MNAQQIQVCQGSRWLLNSTDLPKGSVNSSITWLNSGFFLIQRFVFTCNVAEWRGAGGEGLCLLGIFPSREIYKEWIKNMVSGNELMHITS